MSMLVYHGTIFDFTQIDLSKSRNKRDFGIGFYTTTILEQATSWAENLFARYGGSTKLVKVYEYEPIQDVNIYDFPQMNEEWLNFVKNNRTSDTFVHSYDIVSGPIANDNTMRTIALYISGIYNAKMALEKLAYFKANNQISFHTQKALTCLKWVRDITEF